MEESNNKNSVITQLYRRIRYQGTAQWIFLILGVSCIGVWMLTTPLGPSKYRPSLSKHKASADTEENAVNTIEENGENAPDSAVKTADGGDKEEELDINDETTADFLSSAFWDGVDWDEPMELPDKVAGRIFEMTVETGEEDIELKLPNGKIQVVTVFYRESVPKTKPKMDILLLHGSRFNSETWITIDTTKTLAAMGYRATALDLSGFGNTAGSVLFGDRAIQFIEKFCQAHGLVKPVIVAPSMSGGYAMPYIMSHPSNVTGLVVMGSTSVERYNEKQYAQLKVPILIIYGSKDSNFGKQLVRRLSAAPNTQTRIVQDAFHTVYLDQPDEWHRLCYIFFRRLEQWQEKHIKEKISTTPHPVIVIHNPAETPGPESIASLNLPPRTKEQELLNPAMPALLPPILREQHDEVKVAKPLQLPSDKDFENELPREDQPVPEGKETSEPAYDKYSVEKNAPTSSAESGVNPANPKLLPKIPPQQQPVVSLGNSKAGTKIQRPVDANYPAGGFQPPNYQASQIRAQATHSLAGLTPKEFQKFQEEAARKASLLPVGPIPDVRPVPPDDSGAIPTPIPMIYPEDLEKGQPNQDKPYDKPSDKNVLKSQALAAAQNDQVVNRSPLYKVQNTDTVQLYKNPDLLASPVQVALQPFNVARNSKMEQPDGDLEKSEEYNKPLTQLANNLPTPAEIISSKQSDTQSKVLDSPILSPRQKLLHLPANNLKKPANEPEARDTR